MKFEENPGGIHRLELTRRNLEVLLDKLDLPGSSRTIVCGDNSIMVTAVENDEHYADRPAGVMLTTDGLV